MSDLEVLKEFLTLPLESSDGVFDKFLLINYAIIRGERPERFAYLRGARKNKVLLVAHADTYWDNGSSQPTEPVNQITDEGGIIRPKLAGLGLGADDRAGCAMLWLLKDSGHSLLLTDGEEHGRKGSGWLRRNNPDIFEEINRDHRFIIQLDRRNGRDFKCYDVGSDEFRKYVFDRTGYSEPDRSSFTDIVTLCRDICGVNLSVGYQNEHGPDEKLVIADWEHTLELCRDWLGEKDLKRYPLNGARA